MNPVDLIAEIERLPTLSSAALRVMQMVNDPDISAGQVEQVLRGDPALTANLLRLANSSHYRGLGDIVSVAQAINRLGMREVSALAATMAFGRVIPDKLPGYGIDAEQFWRHSLAVAVFAAEIGKLTQIGTDGSAFTAGLLHDLGKLAIGTFLLQVGERELQRRLAEGALTFVGVERDLLQTDHAEAGHAIAVRWRLPDAIVQTTRFHHRPLEAPKGPAGDVCKTVHLANALAHVFGYGGDIGELSRGLDPQVMADLHLRPEQLEEIAARAMDPIRDMSSVMEM